MIHDYIIGDFDGNDNSNDILTIKYIQNNEFLY